MSSSDFCQASSSETALVPRSASDRHPADRTESKQDDAERASPVDGIEKRASRGRGAAHGHREVLTALRPIDQREHRGGDRQPPRRRPRLDPDTKDQIDGQDSGRGQRGPERQHEVGAEGVAHPGVLWRLSRRAWPGPCPRAFFRLAYSTRLGGGSTSFWLRPVLDRVGVDLLVDVDEHERRRLLALPAARRVFRDRDR